MISLLHLDLGLSLGNLQQSLAPQGSDSALGHGCPLPGVFYCLLMQALTCPSHGCRDYCVKFSKGLPFASAVCASFSDLSRYQRPMPQAERRSSIEASDRLTRPALPIGRMISASSRKLSAEQINRSTPPDMPHLPSRDSAQETTRHDTHRFTRNEGRRMHG